MIEYKNPNFYGNGKTEGEGRKVKCLLEHDELTVKMDYCYKFNSDNSKCYLTYCEYLNIRYFFKKSLLYKHYPELAFLIQDINKGQIFLRKEYKPCIKDGIYLYDKKIKPYLKEISFNS